MIKLQNLSKSFGDQFAVSNMNFHIEQGEICGLLGLNGAGKSTILKMLGCFLSPTSGTAEIAGFNIQDDPDRIRESIGYLPDTPPLYNEMSVSSYLKFVAQLKNVGKDVLSRNVDLAIAQTNLGDVEDKRISNLSHGYRQRVGIAGAIVHRPKVLIFDEPINGLDPIQIVEMRDLILSLKGDHTVILSSHILSEITQTCDRIIIVDKGKLVAEGGESELRKQGNSYKLVTESQSDSLQSQIESIAGVASVEKHENSLSIYTTTDCRKEITTAAMSFGILEFSAKRNDLEDLFLKFVGGHHE